MGIGRQVAHENETKFKPTLPWDCHPFIVPLQSFSAKV